MGTRITDEGIVWRHRWSARERLLRWDDVVRVDEDRAIGRAGERVRLSPEEAGAARRACEPFPAGPAPEDWAPRLQAWLAGPFAAVTAARALLAFASAARATDVHVVPEVGGASVLLRIDGELRPTLRLVPRAAQRLIAAWKGLAGCLPYRRDVVQEGRIARETPGPAADVRASFVPTAFGERVALRLFGRLRTLDELGLAEEEVRALRAALSVRRGLFLVAGATGAGKTTTLYAALAHLASTRGGAHLSLEDPVEQRLRAAGIPVDQVELDPSRGLDGEAVLAASLRQDVDVLAVGEIRTRAEAVLAVGAAHTGRLVLAGIHAGSAEEARQRLLDLGVERALLEATLASAVHQELLTTPCACASAPCGECGGTKRRRRARLRFLAASRAREAAA